MEIPTPTALVTTPSRHSRQGYRGGEIVELVEVVEAGSRVVVVMRSNDPEPGEPELHANLSTFHNGKVSRWSLMRTLGRRRGQSPPTPVQLSSNFRL